MQIYPAYLRVDTAHTFAVTEQWIMYFRGDKGVLHFHVTLREGQLLHFPSPFEFWCLIKWTHKGIYFFFLPLLASLLPSFLPHFLLSIFILSPSSPCFSFHFCFFETRPGSVAQAGFTLSAPHPHPCHSIRLPWGGGLLCCFPLPGVSSHSLCVAQAS